MDNQLVTNLDKIHTTEMGRERIKNNLNLNVEDVLEWCKIKIIGTHKVIREGKNWYVYIGDFVLTINAHSFTIITAHKINGTIHRNNNL